MNFTTQVNDFDPGIHPYPDGLFWTVPMPADSVDVQFGAGKASMKGENISAPDYFNIPNALFRFMPGYPIPATVSFDIRWSGPVKDRYNLKDPDVGFAGEFVESLATMTWSAERSDGFRFVSDPSGTVSAFAQLSHMRNGVFYSG